MKTNLAIITIWIGSLATPLFAVAQTQLEKERNFADRLQIGEKAPALDIAHWLGKSNEVVSEFKQGHVYVVDFWGTWCGACIGEMPELAEIQKEFAERNVTIISVTDETLDEVNAFLDRPCHHNDKMTYRELTTGYHLTADPDGSVFNEYMKGIPKRSFPMMAIVGKTGLIEFIGTTAALKPILKSIVADKWDREYIKKEQNTNWVAGETMMKVNELRRDGKIDEAIELLNQQFEQANLALRTISYRSWSERLPDTKSEPGSEERLEKELGLATVECMRWERNRFSFLLSQRSSAAVEPFRKLVAAYESSPYEQINLAWRVYGQLDKGTEVDQSLILAAKEVASKVSARHPEDAIFLDVYAHLQHAAGDTDAAMKTFELALKKATDGNREEIQHDYQEFLKSIEK